jgi:hypothetical protein
MIVERLAQALGMWGDFSGATTLEPGPGGYRVWTPGGPEVAQREPASVDEGTALIFLLALALGLRLDVGRCPACERRGRRWLVFSAQAEDGRPRHEKPSLWAHDMGADLHEVSLHMAPRPGCVYASLWVAPCPECSEPGPPIACDALMCHDGQVPTTEYDYVRGQHGVCARVMTRSHDCPACEGKGKKPGPPQPTGRRILGAEAILEAMQRPGEGPYTERVDDDFDGHDIELWDPPESGDQAVRDALAVHADRLQADGNPLGELLAAWLRGECQVCEGGKIHEWAHATSQGWDPVAPGLAGPALPWLGKATNTWRIAGFGKACRKMQCCHGHGTVLGALWEELDALAAEWCERLEDATAS